VFNSHHELLLHYYSIWYSSSYTATVSGTVATTLLQ